MLKQTKQLKAVGVSHGNSELERLDFSLPSFTRLTWVSETAKSVWQPRFERIIRAWRDIEYLTVLSDVRSCGIITLSLSDLVQNSEQWLRQGLTFLPLSVGDVSTSHFSRLVRDTQNELPTLQIAIGRTEVLQSFQKGLECDDSVSVGRLLSYPDCCQAFLKEGWLQYGLTDATWLMAVNPLSSTGVQNSNDIIEISGPPQANILWRWLDIRAVCHLPCCPDCSATVEIANQFTDTGRSAGYAEEMDWLLDVLSWPVEWSALHGIAEVKTPILRICTSTDATARKYTVQRLGESYPKEGARALNFPYQMPRVRRVTQSRSYQQGLNNPIAVLPVINGE